MGKKLKRYALLGFHDEEDREWIEATDWDLDHIERIWCTTQPTNPGVEYQIWDTKKKIQLPPPGKRTKGSQWVEHPTTVTGDEIKKEEPENKYILLEDDCAPDAYEFFCIEFERMLGITVDRFKDYGDRIEYGFEFEGYRLEYFPDAPQHHLSRVK